MHNYISMYIGMYVFFVYVYIVLFLSLPIYIYILYIYIYTYVHMYICVWLKQHGVFVGQSVFCCLFAISIVLIEIEMVSLSFEGEAWLPTCLKVAGCQLAVKLRGAYVLQSSDQDKSTCCDLCLDIP